MSANSDGKEASLQGASGKQLRLISSIKCNPGTRFHYHSEFEGEFTFPGDQTKTYYPVPLGNPKGMEQTCMGN
jgi:hypothetical protein